MAIDPRIPLGGQPMQIRSPLAAYGDIERIRAIEDARADRAAEQRDREEARRDRESERVYRDQGRAREQAKRDVFAKTPRKADGSIDYARVSAELGGIDPEASVSLARFGQQEETSNLNHRKALLEHDREQLAYIGQVVGSAQDQASWDQALARLAERQIPVQGVSRVFNPRERDQLVQQGLTHAERVNAELAKIRASANIQSKTVKFKGRAVEVPFNPDTGEYTMPDGTKQKFAEHYEQPRAGEGDNGSHWRDVEETLPDGSKIVRSKRVKDGDVIKTSKPDVPEGMEDYLQSMKMRGYTREQADKEIDAIWASHIQKDHPTLRRVAVSKALDVLIPKARANASDPLAQLYAEIEAEKSGGGQPLSTFGQPPPVPAAPVSAPPPMGPSAAAASPTRPAIAQPPMNAPSTPTMNTNTPPATNQRATPPSVTPPSTPPQHGEQRELNLPDGSKGVARFNAQTGKWIRVR